jgi:predicted dehydrogenase
MADKLRAGVIGCGSISKNHVKGYLNCGRYDLVALSDLNESAMEDMDRMHGITTNHYTDAREMMARENLDVVSICTWHSGHAPWTIAVSNFKPKAILCEKPMADTLGKAEQMLVSCRRNGVKLVIGHQRRFLPSYTLAKERI